LIAVGGSSGTKLYDVNTGNEIWKASAGHKSPTPGHIAFAPNGRTIALSLGDGVVRLFDWAHDKQWSFKGANKGPYQLAFSSDGTRLAGVENTSALIWDVADVTSQPPPKHDDASPKDLDDWCNQLGSPNSGAAYQAVWKLVGARDSAVPKLKAMLTQADPAAYKQIGRWIANLNSEHFVVREKAAKELFTLGDAALAPIEEALKETLSLEQRRRLQAISKSLRDKSMAAERLKELRTIMALEQIGTPSARAAIEWLNHGLVTAWITQQARLALNRMDDRKSRER
jgi:hypothetical protein